MLSALLYLSTVASANGFTDFDGIWANKNNECLFLFGSVSSKSASFAVLKNTQAFYHFMYYSTNDYGEFIGRAKSSSSIYGQSPEFVTDRIVTPQSANAKVVPGSPDGLGQITSLWVTVFGKANQSDDFVLPAKQTEYKWVGDRKQVSYNAKYKDSYYTLDLKQSGNDLSGRLLFGRESWVVAGTKVGPCATAYFVNSATNQRSGEAYFYWTPDALDVIAMRQGKRVAAKQIRMWLELSTSHHDEVMLDRVDK